MLNAGIGLSFLTKEFRMPIPAASSFECLGVHGGDQLQFGSSKFLE